MFGLFACCSPQAQDPQKTAASLTANPSSQHTSKEVPIAPVALETALQPLSVAVVSIACCGMGSASDDVLALRAVSEGMQLADAQGDVALVSAMDAQRYAGNIPSSAEPTVKRLVQQITALYTQHGFAAFPIVLIDRRVAFYGGIPSAEQFAERHRRWVGEHAGASLAAAT